MPENLLFKEFKKTKKNNTLQADVSAMLVEVIEELIQTRKELDELTARVVALEPKPKNLFLKGVSNENATRKDS
jgi:hypothetical protein